MIIQTHKTDDLNLTLIFHEDACSEVTADILKILDEVEIKLTRVYWRDMSYYPECEYLTNSDDKYIENLISKIFNIYPDANTIE